ncbi:hypothetical protein QUF72_05340 [Desulfobacterales bacterium HSG2]|nr:hypothetical protein [Desulfobacterales bacterium HSG2]
MSEQTPAGSRLVTAIKRGIFISPGSTLSFRAEMIKIGRIFIISDPESTLLPKRCYNQDIP